MATLTVTTTTDFRGGAVETNITDIVFNTSGLSIAFFEPAQFGPGLISNTVHITGDGFLNQIDVSLSSPGSFSAAGWTFANWGSGDTVLINGTTGNDNITGSSQGDVIYGFGGLNNINAGAGNDSIRYTAVAVAGTTIEGGTGFDMLELSLAGTTDLRPITITGVERLNLGPSMTAIVSGDQIGADGFTSVYANGVAPTVSLIVSDSFADLSGVTFLNWNANDTIEINGTSAMANTLVGSSQADVISCPVGFINLMTGGGGADHLNGDAGNDYFFYVASSDVVAGEVVDGGANTDTISLSGVSGINFALATIVDVEMLDFASGNSTATFAGDQIVAGEIATVSGSAGIDQLIVTTDDQFADLSGVTFTSWTNGPDKITIVGSAHGDTMIGSQMSDRLDGGGGADYMSGGTYSDTYVVDNAGDRTIEAAGAGPDTVLTSISWTLAANVENLTLTGSANINATGNTGANAITGNSAANVLSGLAGNDALTGFGGNDRLDGGANVDTMAGGNGNDTYIVDNVSDTVDETTGSGIDTVQSSVSFALGTGVENLTLTGATTTKGTGNSAANTIIGNSAANTLLGYGGNDRLDGSIGADAMSGGNGNDTYVVDNAGDTASEASGSGVDVVQSTVTFTLAGGVENLVLNGGSDINGMGNSGANTMYGNSAVNRLDGNGGVDTMTGFGGADVFVFADGDGTDIVTDFQNGSDKCDLTALANVDEFSDLVLTDTGAGVNVDYGTGSFELANVADINTIGASDFVF